MTYTSIDNLKVIVIVGELEVVMLARTAVAFTTQARHGGHTNGVVAHGARHTGESGKWDPEPRLVWPEMLSGGHLRSRTSRQLGRHYGEQ